ncbi:serine protease Do [Roseiarcus fermentans]|uniref:Probable periplasmic serine endoprotease DegP-like n=1 Tax=Roseiarcus fermentans TaxID=1473586 RepID=A0A366FUT1_9HYPH|nr:DegQ family serine endoprotease [Roseiarcus fermentans]RBP18261.1 serine protease Do [Roseiarcus fermentans]
MTHPARSLTPPRPLGPALAAALAAVLIGAPPGAAVAQTRPNNLADLVDQVADAVVNISATQTIEEKGGGAMPNLPKGTPFDEMFEEFFKNHGVNPRPRAQKAQSLGSGFVVDPSGIVITNNHVVGDANDIVVIFNDGRKLKAKVIGKDSKVDVAVLKVESDKPLKTVKFGDSDKARVGDGVMAVGNPFGLGETVTAGIVSARNRNIDSGPYDDFLQTDASINKGNSGGPLFNLQGEVIGINTAILSPSGGSIGIGFATPSATVQPVIAQLEQFHETRRGWLGVRIQPVDDTIAESLNLGTARGALVAGVDDQGPAKPAGLKAGDVIVRFDGKEIKESRDLPRIVAGEPVGKAVDVVVVRNGQEVTKSVTLGRLEDGEKTAEAASAEDPTAETNVVQKALGMEFSGITDDVRKSFKIKESVKGVVVTSVEQGSPAAERGLRPGDVIEEVNHQAVEKPADLTKALADAKKDGGKKPALLLVANGEGMARFVAVPVE